MFEILKNEQASLRAVGNRQGGSLSDGVGLVSLNNGGWGRAVRGVCLDGLSGGDPDWRRHRGVVRWWRSHIAVGNWSWGVGWLDRVGDSARAV